MISDNQNSRPDFSSGTIACPDCGETIQLDLQKLMSGGSATCMCGTRLSINVEENQEAIKAITQAQEVLARATSSPDTNIDDL